MSTLAEFQGYGAPRTLRGLASTFGPMPWRLSGRVLTIWYRLQDPAEARRQNARPLEVEADPVCRARFYELTFNAGLGDDLPALNPEQSRLYEATVGIPVTYRDIGGDYSLHLYSDNFAYAVAAREVIGWPVKLAKIALSQTWQLDALQAGVAITGRLERYGEGLLTARARLTGPLKLEKRPASPPNWFTYKVIPSPEGNGLETCELVLVCPQRVQVGAIWAAEASLSMGEAINDELHFLRPREIVLAEYWPQFELVLGYGRVLERFV